MEQKYPTWPVVEISSYQTIQYQLIIITIHQPEIACRGVAQRRRASNSKLKTKNPVLFALPALRSWFLCSLGEVRIAKVDSKFHLRDTIHESRATSMSSRSPRAGTKNGQFELTFTSYRTGRNGSALFNAFQLSSSKNTNTFIPPRFISPVSLSSKSLLPSAI